MLVIDEIHAMLSGTFREQRIFLNCLRFLANDLHLPLGCVGTNEAKLLSRGRTPCTSIGDGH
jgi:Bacterial TniB protein